MPAEFFLLRAEGEPGGAVLDQEARDAVRTPFSRARHHEVDVGAATARNERLGAIEHVMIVPALRAGFQARGIRAGVWLGQAVAGELGHAAEIGKKALPQLARTVSIDHPRDHVVDREIGGSRGTALRQLLEDQDGIEARERGAADVGSRSEEHTSELQSQSNLVCRLLLEKKKKK